MQILEKEKPFFFPNDTCIGKMNSKKFDFVLLNWTTNNLLQ